MTEHDQSELGQRMLELAKKEGHRPGRITNINYGIPTPSRHRKVLQEFFNTNRTPISTSAVAENCNVPKDTVRDLCKVFKKDGWLVGEKTAKGYFWRVPNHGTVPA